MQNHPCIRLTIMAALCGPVMFGHSVRGASIGLQESEAQHLLQAADLPRLYGNAPAQVPHFSNPGLIKFWLNHEFSPILRDPAIQMQLCAAVSQARDLAPERFDRNHPILGRLFRDSSFFSFVLHAYNSHPSRFVFYHHHLIPLLRGCELMKVPPVTPPAVSPGQITGPGSSSMSPVPEGISNNGPQVVAVPAPASLILMLFGMGFVAARSRGRRPMART